MKKLLALGAMCLLGIAAHAQSSGTYNMNALENQVIAKAQDCIAPYRIGHHRVEGVLVAVGDCLNGNPVYIWDIYVFYYCNAPGTAVCDPLPARLVAHGGTTCDGDIFVECR